MVTARLIEIFQSLQGEGPYAGAPTVFVRFQDCALACRYCDTPASFRASPTFRVEQSPGSAQFETLDNPVSAQDLNLLLEKFPAPTLSLTGGEPLQHHEFLAHWLPQAPKRFRLLLETNGVLPDALDRVLPHLDLISMDLKLPSATGMGGYWEEHEAFLKRCRGKELYVKVVVVPSTPESEILRAVDLVRRVCPEAPFILQPVTPRGQVRQSVSADQLDDWLKVSQGLLNDVRIIPQRHVEWGIL